MANMFDTQLIRHIWTTQELTNLPDDVPCLGNQKEHILPEQFKYAHDYWIVDWMLLLG